MASVQPTALRLIADEWADKVPSPAHDALTPAARRNFLAQNPDSYLAVTRGPEDLGSEQHLSTDELLFKGREALDHLISRGAFGPVNSPRFYLYQLETADHLQTAVLADVATENFSDGKVRLHELVQLDRASHLSRHLDIVAAQSSPIALAYRGSPRLKQTLIQASSGIKPSLVFSTGDGVIQRVWEITDPDVCTEFVSSFEDQTLYLIDGHHRAAAARSRQQTVGDHASSYILSAIFSADELRNRAHHRVLSLGDGADDFLRSLRDRLEVRTIEGTSVSEETGASPIPDPDEIEIWAKGTRYLVRIPLPATNFGQEQLEIADRLALLDPVRLQKAVIGPILGVDGSWSGSQLTYRPGVLPVHEIREDTEANNEILCVMRPVPIEDLLDASDHGLVLPPKSTYFEPKARSGVFVRHLTSQH